MAAPTTSTPRTRRHRAKERAERDASRARILQLERALRAERERADAAGARLALVERDQTERTERLLADSIHAAVVDERQALERARAGIRDLHRDLKASREDVVFVVAAILYTYSSWRDASPDAFAQHAVHVERLLRRTRLGLPANPGHPFEVEDVPSLLFRCLIRKPKSIRFPTPQDPVVGLVERALEAHWQAVQPAAAASPGDVAAARRDQTIRLG